MKRLIDQFQYVEQFKTWAAAWVFLFFCAVGFWFWIHSHLKKYRVRQYRQAKPFYVFGNKTEARETEMPSKNNRSAFLVGNKMTQGRSPGFVAYVVLGK